MSARGTTSLRARLLACALSASAFGAQPRDGRQDAVTGVPGGLYSSEMIFFPRLEGGERRFAAPIFHQLTGSLGLPRRLFPVSDM